MVSISNINTVSCGKKSSLFFHKKDSNGSQSNPLKDTNLNLQPNSYGIGYVPGLQTKKTPAIVLAGGKAFKYTYKEYKQSDVIEGKIQNEYVVGKYNPRYRDEINASPLPVVTETSCDSLNIENFVYPNGTIAIPSTFDESITTGGLWQCVGIAIVDKKQNLQTLVHYCPSVSGGENKKLLNYILSASNPKDVEISLVPGCYEDTDKTLVDIMTNLQDFQQEKNTTFKSIDFKYFPNSECSNIVLHNGELSCVPHTGVHYCSTNPEKRIVYASMDKSIKPW